MSTESNDQYRAGFEATAPRVESCIADVMARFKGISDKSQARYFEEVHQHLAPLARELERELAKARASAAAAWEQLRASKREASTEPSAEGRTMMVPRYATEAIVVAIEREIDSQLTASGMAVGDMQRQDGYDVWEAAIGAVDRAGSLSDDAKDAALTPCAYRVGQYKIEEVGQVEGPALWAVRVNGYCLNKSDTFEWEPSPSGREDDFLERCRFESARAASTCLAGAIEAHKTGSPDA